MAVRLLADSFSYGTSVRYGALITEIQVALSATCSSVVDMWDARGDFAEAALARGRGTLRLSDTAGSVAMLCPVPEAARATRRRVQEV